MLLFSGYVNWKKLMLHTIPEIEYQYYPHRVGLDSDMMHAPQSSQH